MISNTLIKSLPPIPPLIISRTRLKCENIPRFQYSEQLLRFPVNMVERISTKLICITESLFIFFWSQSWRCVKYAILIISLFLQKFKCIVNINLSFYLSPTCPSPATHNYRLLSTLPRYHTLTTTSSHFSLILQCNMN